MLNKETEKFEGKSNPTEKPAEVIREDPLADVSGLISKEIPPGVDRRNFLIRSAVGGAAAVMMGRSVSTQETIAKALATLPTQAPASTPAAFQRPERRQKGPGAGDDYGGRVLQSGTRTFQLAHDRSDAYYLRFLPASHQTAG